MSALERELGASLINRGVRPWTLTAAGELLYERAETALAELALAEADLAALATGETGQVRVASVPSGLRSVVPLAAAAFRARHGDIQLLLAESQSSAILKQLRGDEVDVGIIVTPGGHPPAVPRHLTATLLVEQPLMVVVPASSPIARLKRVTLEQLRDEEWLLPSPRRVADFREEVDALFREAEYTPRMALELEDDVAGQALVAAGLGIALIPSLAAPTPRPDLRTIPLQPARARALHVITARGPHRKPVTTFVRELERAANKLTLP